MGLLYDNKKLIAASWLLRYLSNNHCYKCTSTVSEYNGYRVDLVGVADISKKTVLFNFSKELLEEASDILFSNRHKGTAVLSFITQDKHPVLIKLNFCLTFNFCKSGGTNPGQSN